MIISQDWAQEAYGKIRRLTAKSRCAMVVSEATTSQPALSEVKGAVNAATCCNPERTNGGPREAPICRSRGCF